MRVPGPVGPHYLAREGGEGGRRHCYKGVEFKSSKSPADYPGM